ncbi:MAG: hypothetical protein IKX17_02990, partial [Prevotella sp.]|nr:hypothetical protein [Prevotella sp.]
NVGATKPEEYGDYFAWGETTPKENYTWETYKWCIDNRNNLTKYCNYSSLGNNGFTDNKTELDLEDDAAYMNWGSNWRMPNSEQIQEITSNCNWEWAQLNGISGFKVTGPNGNSIFLPAAGWRANESLYDSTGEYFSCTLRTDDDGPDGAHYLHFDSNGVSWRTWSRRSHGLSIRPVRR